MEFSTLWFILIATLWIGYVALEGFDFGVGMLMSWFGRKNQRLAGDAERNRRLLLNTIGPVWDGNEVWLLTAIGATFAAFPGWYGAMLSGYYLPVLAIIVGLIVRAVAIDYRHKGADDRWRAWCDGAILVGSTVPPFGWGSILVGMFAGLPVDSHGEMTGSAWDVITVPAIVGGLALLVASLSHGLLFTALKTDGDIRAEARRYAPIVTSVAAVLLAASLVLTGSKPAVSWAGAAVVVALAGAAVVLVKAGREGAAFGAHFLALGVWVGTLFASTYPTLIPSKDGGAALTVESAASSDLTLTIMTWAGLAILPIVIGYQAWTYWVFRKRLTVNHIGPVV